MPYIGARTSNRRTYAEDVAGSTRPDQSRRLRRELPAERRQRGDQNADRSWGFQGPNLDS